MVRAWLPAALACLLAAAPAVAQLPDGYFLVDSMPVLPSAANETYAQGRLSVEIARSVAPDDLEFVTLAERIFPRPELIEADAAEFVEGRGGNWARSFEEARARPGLRWWWNTFDEVPIPWALTGHTVHDLRATIQRFAVQPLSFFSPDTRIGLEYTATVERLAMGRRAVPLTVRWSMACGPLCGLWFAHERVVTFDADGAVVSISGDGRPSYSVS